MINIIMDKFNLGVIICVFSILFVFQLLETFLKPKSSSIRQVGAQSTLPILPPGVPPEYIDDKCDFIVRRQKERTVDPTSGMTQPMLRPCGLNHIFIQNCKGEMLNGKGPGKPLEWEKEEDIHQSGDQAGCFLIVPPLNPAFKSRPGYYVSIRSVKWDNYYIKMEKGKAVLAYDPFKFDRCWACERPVFKDYIFKITRGYAKFNRAFSILNWRHDYLRVDGKHLVIKKEDPKTTEEKINSTLYFGPNNHLLIGIQ